MSHQRFYLIVVLRTQIVFQRWLKYSVNSTTDQDIDIDSVHYAIPYHNMCTCYNVFYGSTTLTRCYSIVWPSSMCWIVMKCYRSCYGEYLHQNVWIFATT